MKINKAHIKRSLKSLVQMLKQDKLYRWTLVVSLLFVALTIALPLWRILPVVSEKPFIPLHYNIHFGVDRFGPWYHLFILPAVGLLALTVNTFVHTRYHRREPLGSKIFSVMNVLMSAVLFISMSLIMLINI